jgi:hypothetical protein
MLTGLPRAVSRTAARPTAPPARTTNQFTFFIVDLASLMYLQDCKTIIENIDKKGKSLFPMIKLLLSKKTIIWKR